ncbi:hypothetical protein YB2330_003045 [Saitoella coloradoensis]
MAASSSFLPFTQSPPPKEGRVKHSHIFQDRQFKRAIIAFVGFIVFYLFVLPTLHQDNKSAVQKYDSLGAPSSPLSVDAKAREVPTRHHRIEYQGAVERQGNEAPPPPEKPSKAELPAGAVDAHIPPAHAEYAPSSPQQQIQTKTQSGNGKELVSGPLRDLLEMLPDEFRMRELLRPIKSSGTERMREYGLRARVYRKMLEAWERVHFASAPSSSIDKDNSGIVIRNDITQVIKHNSPDLLHIYDDMTTFFSRFSNLLFPWTAPFHPSHPSLHASLATGGRGIVLTAGDNQAPFLLTGIKVLRELGCKLPVEVMYLGDDDLGEDWREKLEELEGVVTRDMARMVSDRGWKLAGWAGKPFAILLSSFRECIFIDADSLFFKDPTILFEDKEYKEKGALFFKDRLIFPESKKRFLQEILPKPLSAQVKSSRFWTGASGHMQESGVLVIDKFKHFVALLMVTRLNGPDRDGSGEGDDKIVGVYDLVYGDKETFWLGWELVGDVEYAWMEGGQGIMGIVRTKERGSVKEETDKEKLEKAIGGPKGYDEKGGEDVDDNDHRHDDYKDAEDKDAKEEEKAEKEEHALRKRAPVAGGPHTICSPQLLHLDRDGTPLWFNGWLAPNKFDDVPTPAAALSPSRKSALHFESWLKEPGEWELLDSNICCLTSEERTEFTEGEKEVLGMMIRVAKEVEAWKG